MRFVLKRPIRLKILYLNFSCSLFYNKKNFRNASTRKKPFKSIKVESYSFIFIRSVMCENDKKVPFIIRDFHTK